MKKIFSFLAIFAFVFVVFGNEKVSAAEPIKLKLNEHFTSTDSDSGYIYYYDGNLTTAPVGGLAYGPSTNSILATVTLKPGVVLDYVYGYGSSNVTFQNADKTVTGKGGTTKLSYAGKTGRVSVTGNISNSSMAYVYEVELYGYVTDTVPPSDIQNFSSEFDEDLNLTLKYSLPTDSDFSHLKIYKNSELIQDNYTENSFVLNGISPFESNQFRIVSVDNSNNESAGFIQTVVAPDGPDFVAPQNILELKQKVSGNAIQFNYILPTDDDFSHLQIYRNNELIIENHKINSFNDSDLEYESNYNYVFKSVDTSGNVSEGLSIATVTGKEVDLTPPDVPTGLTVKNGNSALYVTWNPNSETDIEGYNLYINDVKYNGSVIAGNSFTISNLENMKAYNIKVSAVDTSANESGMTAGVNGVPDEKAMPIVKVKNNLGAVATSTENWFAQLWLPLAFGVSIPLAFIIGSRVKSLFLA